MLNICLLISQQYYKVVLVEHGIFADYVNDIQNLY